MTKGKACAVRAFLEGYDSKARALTRTDAKSDMKLGKLILGRCGATSKGLFSSADEQADKERKDFDKALDLAANGDLQSAIAGCAKPPRATRIMVRPG